MIVRILFGLGTAALVAMMGCAAPDDDVVPDETLGDMSIARPSEDAAAPDAAPPSDSAPAADAATCSVDLAATVACGRCGTAAQTCVDGKVVIGTCMGETGACVPGAVERTSDGCQVRTCGKDCRWPGWSLKPGAACATGSVESCNAGPSCPHAGKRKCLPSCQWAPTCTC